jgi:hypothetical protein
MTLTYTHPEENVDTETIRVITVWFMTVTLQAGIIMSYKCQNYGLQDFRPSPAWFQEQFYTSHYFSFY